MHNNLITGIILAGGKSSRMGTDKALERIKGKRLIDITVELLKSYCSEILISSNSNIIYNPKIEQIEDKIKEIGPLGGIYSCLHISKNIQNIIITCDMPYINDNIIKVLLKENSKEEIVNFQVNGIFMPFPGLYSKSILPNLKEYINQKKYSPKYFVIENKTKIINLEDDLEHYYGEYFKNINTKEDLEINN